jgi:hypothetical protein
MVRTVLASGQPDAPAQPADPVASRLARFESVPVDEPEEMLAPGIPQ